MAERVRHSQKHRRADESYESEIVRERGRDDESDCPPNWYYGLFKLLSIYGFSLALDTERSCFWGVLPRI
jgi:hypothetical protein